ncbi:hypothetical protein [uncultured Muribaculum sp.]|uniref:hypothetical protein n=1 Tax=uncultured Muribaculum sp. TaxID=1918613 RepID=UPI00261D6742|nr:hypothetical protein [uncultured Muribaculum sp.]
MEKSLFKTALAASLLALSMTSCNILNPGPVPENIVGDEPGELQAKIGELLEKAGTDSAKVEFAEIYTSFINQQNDNIANAHVQIVSPDDKDKMVQYSWSDMKDRRNMYERFELTVATHLDNDVVDTYEGYKDMLFNYGDIKVYLENLPTYCKEALEASGYKDKGYICDFMISKDDVNIGVKHKDGGFSKTYKISNDGQHIVVPE